MGQTSYKAVNIIVLSQLYLFSHPWLSADRPHSKGLWGKRSAVIGEHDGSMTRDYNEGSDEERQCDVDIIHRSLSVPLQPPTANLTDFASSENQDYTIVLAPLGIEQASTANTTITNRRPPRTVSQPTNLSVRRNYTYWYSNRGCSRLSDHYTIVPAPLNRI